MKIDTIITILTEELGASEDGDRYRLPEGKKISLLVRGGDSVIPLSKVREVRLTDEFAKVTTEECAFYVHTDAVLALRVDDPNVGSEKRPGFH